MPPPGLTELDLSQCSRISDIGVIHVVRFAGLRRLSLAHCPQLGDSAVSRLSQSCPALEWLRLANCVSLTDHGVIGLVKHARRLKHLDLQVRVRRRGVGEKGGVRGVTAGGARRV